MSDEYHIGRHVSNLFVTQTYEGQSDIHSKKNTRSLDLSHVLTCLLRFDTWPSHHRYTGFCLIDSQRENL